MLSIIQCKPTAINRDCFDIVTQVSSARLQILNLSFMDEEGEDLDATMAERRQDLTAIDRHLQQGKFVNFKCLNLGVPGRFIKASQDYFTQTSLKGMVHVMTVEEVNNLPCITSEMHSIPM